MSKIHYQNQTYDFQQIPNIQINEVEDEYLQSTLLFCQKWLRGDATFTLHTSGSTGQPKVIDLTRSQLEASAKMTISFLNLQSLDKALVCLNTSYIAGVMMLVRGMVGNLELWVTPPSSKPFTAIEQKSFDFVALVPLQVQTILDDSESLSIFENMKAVLIGGAPISFSLNQRIQIIRSEVAIYHTYGMTETVSHIALKKLNGEGKSEFFQILKGIQVKTDERACLQIKGTVTQNEWITTNDLVRFEGEKAFEWLGRADFIINSGGVKVQPEKVENTLASILFEMKIDNTFAVLGLDDSKLGQKIVVVFEGLNQPLETENQLIQQLGKKLNKYEVPREILYIEQFPRTKTGKVNRKDIQIALNRVK